VKVVVIAVIVAVTLLLIPAAALAVDGSGGAGQDYGLHHAGMAQDMGGFTGDMNPGVHHEGFSGWTGPE
jgi:hypothetical protein